MTASNPSNEFAPRPVSETDADADPAEKTERQQLLDEVLQETLRLVSADVSLSTEEMRPLLALARLRKGERLDVETMRELVQTALRLRFRRLVASSSLWDKMTRQIAQAMMDDPRTNERVQHFWTVLCEAAQ